ncbi:hypothetical protein [Nocardiopsis aegyptia]|uniref:Uncharacterized protein n=1 Tax=Nocardiopsis aegyptia TaxID=220378 RepID=A0A7Z0ELN6_9ACTN|nr:hypothetical protein [Nocardiopsis aegyptia]NYJ34385.1 hypothetical protein [Nocardiopsis aegyptia]
MERAFYLLLTVAMLALLLHVIAQKKGRTPPRAATGVLVVLLVALLAVAFLMILGTGPSDLSVSTAHDEHAL